MTEEKPTAETGYSYFVDHFSDAPVRRDTADVKVFGDNLFLSPNQAIFIFDYSNSSLLYARGFEMLGFDDRKVTIVDIFNTAVPEQREACGEISGKALHFAQHNNLEPMKNGIVLNYRGKVFSNEYVHIMLESSVFSHTDDGTLASAIVVLTKLSHLPLPKIVRWGVFGEMSDRLDEQIDDVLMRPDRVSSREAEVLRRLADGKTMAGIAAELCRSPRTVERHILNMRTRFQCANTSQLVAFGKDMGLI